MNVKLSNAPEMTANAWNLFKHLQLKQNRHNLLGHDVLLSLLDEQVFKLMKIVKPLSLCFRRSGNRRNQHSQDQMPVSPLFERDNHSNDRF